MSIRIMNAVLEQKSTQSLTPATKFVLLMIANNANDEGIALSVYVDRVVYQTNYDERTIRRAFRALVEEGFVTIQERRGRRSIYTILVDRLLSATPGTVTGVTRGAAQEARGATNEAGASGELRVTERAQPADNGAQSGEPNSGAPGSGAEATPGTVTGVTSCGSNIHTPVTESPPGGTVSGVPRAQCHPGLSPCPPSSSLSHISTSLLREEPDDLKSSNGEKADQRGTASPFGSIPAPQQLTPQQRERLKAEQLAKINRALESKVGAA